jgi:redox-sensitive bicupin YhaK (pirin superfamily)
MRTIKNIHKAVYEPIGDLVTYRVMPSSSVPMNLLDPFIFLNHHGWQEYLPHNNGLPFGPHPHRGFETVTFILEGDLTHKDSSGAASVITAGGVQWMTAGSGLIHAEISSKEFKNTGGPLELLQLWINLPAKHKMTPPNYIGLQKEALPVKTWNKGKVTASLVAGAWEEVPGPMQPFTDIHLAALHFKEGGTVSFSVAENKSILLYIVKGAVNVNGTDVHQHHLVEFSNDDTRLQLTADTDAIALFGHATPFREPLVAYGPFVMNTREEVEQAYADYHSGKLGDAETLLED